MAIYIDVIRKNSKAKIVLRAHNIEHYIWNRHKQIETNYFKLKYPIEGLSNSPNNIALLEIPSK